MDHPAEQWVTVAERSGLAPGSVIGVTIGDIDIAIYHVDGEIYATDNICPHADAYLNHGCLRGDVIECPVHGARFEIKTGKGKGNAPFGSEEVRGACRREQYPGRHRQHGLNGNAAGVPHRAGSQIYTVDC